MYFFKRIFRMKLELLLCLLMFAFFKNWTFKLGFWPRAPPRGPKSYFVLFFFFFFFRQNDVFAWFRRVLKYSVKLWLFGHIWTFLDTFGRFWMILDGFRCFLTLFDAFWRFMTLYDALWRFMTLYDALWHFMMLHNPCCITLDNVMIDILMFWGFGHSLTDSLTD